jgi:hypothetical protein
LEPVYYFILVVCITAFAVIAEMISVYRRRRWLRRLAKQWNMHFAAGDRLRLAGRIASRLPVPGCSNVRVRDLLFSTDGQWHRYVFTVEYAVGAVRGKSGRTHVVGSLEPVTHAVAANYALIFAPDNLAPASAYEYVRDALAQPAATA